MKLIARRIALRPVPWCAALLAVLPPAARVQAQSDVRAHHQDGQTFVVWKTSLPHPLTYDIYRFPGTGPAPTNISQGTLAGRVFLPEWAGARLKLMNPSQTWRVPTPAGPTNIASDDGLFVFTPHAAGAEWFAVVKHGDTIVTAARRTSAPVGQRYDPVNEPVTAHPQLSGVSPEGHPFRIFALWVDGRDDENDVRPDFPLMGNRHKMGAPHLFALWEPVGGPGPGDLPLVMTLHGGDGNYRQMRPGNPDYVNIGLTLTDGLLLSHDEVFYFADGNPLQVVDGRTFWLGYWHGLDPFVTQPPAPPPGALVIPYSIRRFQWICDWVQTRSGYAIDHDRVSIMGFSSGSEGTLIQARAHPERFASWTAFCAEMEPPGLPNVILGGTALNLEVKWTGPAGVYLRVGDFYHPEIALSPTERDYPVSRIYIGRNESSWSPARVAHVRNVNDQGWGTHLYWDERFHGVAQWSLGPPAGQWVSPVRTQRGTAQYQTRYRRDRSYPGVFNDDQDPLTPGRQPDPGDGNPAVGDPWGTWAGYCDWELDTIVDTTARWECTLFLVGLSPVSVDNAPMSQAVADVSIRRPQAFQPVGCSPITWTSRDALTGALLQQGTAEQWLDGTVVMRGVTISRDPARRRLRVEACPPCYADCNGDSALNLADFGCFQTRFALGDPYADCNGDAALNLADFGCFQTKFALGCP